MANYNTFVAIDCKSKKPILVTTSARKINGIFTSGVRIEVWQNNALHRTIYYNRNRHDINIYLEIEREYIRQKQNKAEMRNAKRGTICR